MSTEQKPSFAALSSRLSKLGITGAPVVVAQAPSPDTQPGTPAEPLTLAQIDSADKLAQHLQFLASFNSNLRRVSLELVEELFGSSTPIPSFEEVYKTLSSRLPSATAFGDESELNRLCMRFAESPEVQAAVEEYIASQAISAPSSDLSAGAETQKPTSSVVVEVHEYMVLEFSKLISALAAVSESERFQYEPRLVETTAEVLVTLAVRRKFGISTEVMEAATEEHAKTLEKNKRFQKASEQLAMNMKGLHSILKPRLTEFELLAALEGVAANAAAVKEHAKAVRAELLAKDVNVEGVSAKIASFVALTQDQEAGRTIGNPFEARELLERQLVRMGEAENKEMSGKLLAAWEKSQLDLAIFMQAILMMQQDPSLPLPPPPQLTGRKLPELKEVVKMQNAMVDELQLIKDVLQKATEADASLAEKFDGHTFVAFAQALASAGIEEKFGFAAEDLTLAGFKHGPKLAADQKFMQVSMAQQQVLGAIGELGGDVTGKTGGAGPAGAGCSLM